MGRDQGLDPGVGVLVADGEQDRQPLERLAVGAIGGGRRGVEDDGRALGLDGVERRGEVGEEALPNPAQAVRPELAAASVRGRASRCSRR